MHSGSQFEKINLPLLPFYDNTIIIFAFCKHEEHHPQRTPWCINVARLSSESPNTLDRV